MKVLLPLILALSCAHTLIGGGTLSCQKNSPVVRYRPTIDTLTTAVANNNINLVRWYLTRYPNAAIQHDSHGNTPLHWAIGRENVAMVDELTACPTVNLNIINAHGISILKAAQIQYARQNSIQSFKIMKQLNRIRTVQQAVRAAGLS